MGLIRPPDPEHIGDTFLWMRRSEKGPNTFTQTSKNLQPGRLYSFKMFVCDYDDLIHPKPRKVEDTKSIASVLIDGAEVDATRSFTEVYASDSEAKLPHLHHLPLESFPCQNRHRHADRERLAGPTPPRWSHRPGTSLQFPRNPTVTMNNSANSVAFQHNA